MIASSFVGIRLSSNGKDDVASSVNNGLDEDLDETTLSKSNGLSKSHSHSSSFSLLKLNRLASLGMDSLSKSTFSLSSDVPWWFSVSSGGKDA